MIIFAFDDRTQTPSPRPYPRVQWGQGGREESPRAYGERVGVRGSLEPQHLPLPLTLTLSPLKRGERGPVATEATP